MKPPELVHCVKSNLTQFMSSHLLLTAGLEAARGLPGVIDVRVCGAIGVIECDRSVDLAVATPAALDRRVWLRPFHNLVYAMPPYICPPVEIAQITSAMVEVAGLVG
ncbi:hypothetical protein ACN3XK_74815 [Actinomadura welshii]